MRRRTGLATSLALLAGITACAGAQQKPVTQPPVTITYEQPESDMSKAERIELVEDAIDKFYDSLDVDKTLEESSKERAEAEEKLVEALGHSIEPVAGMINKELKFRKSLEAELDESSNRIAELEGKVNRLNSLISKSEEEIPVEITNVSVDTPTLYSGNGTDLIQNTELFLPQLRAWLTKNRTTWLSCYKNFLYHEEEFTEKITRAGLNLPIHFATACQESGWKIDAESWIAHSFFQFRASTGKKYGLKNKRDLHDFSKGLDAHIAYTKFLLELYGNDYLKMTAAYNVGENNDQLKSGKPYWTIENRLPRETRGHVRKVLAGAYLFMIARENPEFLNFYLPSLDGMGNLPITETNGNPITEIRLDMEMSLSELRGCLGNTPWGESYIQLVQNANEDHYDTLNVLIPEGTSVNIPTVALDAYNLHCQPNSNIMKILVESRPKEELYIIRKGDTLSKIAANTKCDWRTIRAYNTERGTPINPRRLRIGKPVWIPATCIK